MLYNLNLLILFLMPKIYEYFGFVFYFYSNEHEPIHVHVIHNQQETIFELILQNPTSYCVVLLDLNMPVMNGYEFIEKTERKVFELDAVSYTYKAVYGGSELRVMQTVFLYNDLLYSITYTAHADRFDVHLEDVEMMLGAFRFR